MVGSRWTALIGACAAALAGCGSSDGSIGVGSGQQPDPVALDFPIAYTKGPLFDEDMELQSNTDLRDVLRFNIGTDLYLLDRASPTAIERNITLAETQGLGDVMGVEISVDGTKVLFSMRGPFDPNLDDEDQPTWKIWEYDLPTDTLRRVIASDITAEAGHDISPHYLADGRIIFASTRQRQGKAILLDEGKPQFDAMDENRQNAAFVLHVMDPDGGNVRQVSFNQSSDFDPTLLDNGKVLFSRWDHAGGVNGIHLYTMNPDGSELELYYGAESHLTGTNGGQVQFIGARETIDGDVMAIVRPFDHPELGGAIAVIDAQTYVENTQPIVDFPGMMGPAQVAATPNQVTTELAPSRGGRFSSAFPLWDGTGRVLVSWSICRLLEPSPADPAVDIIVPCTPERLALPTAEAAPALYGIWMYDPIDQTQLPIVIGEEGVLIGDVVAAQPRPNPNVILDKVAGVDLDPDLVAEGAGILNIRSVYDIDGADAAAPSIAAVADPVQTTAAERPARFLRVEKAVSIPDDDIVDLDNTAFGPNIQQGMREIVAYAPIEPDGSVRLKVPANVALAVSVLDADGRRISPRHQNWLQVLPGEELTCNGCHSPPSGLSHGRRNSFASAYAGAAGTGVAFPNTLAAFSPDFQETMAETRTRVSCATDCAALEPSVDLVYDDVWTDPIVRTPDLSFAYRYSGLTTTPPVDSNCFANWTANCRIVIHYEQHIHPLWGVVREVLDPNDGVTVIANHTCAQSGCHAPLNAMNMTDVPAAQLDLTDGLSPDQADHFNAYRELLFGDNEQELVNGALQDRLVQNGVDAMGNPIFVTVGVGASMSSAGANASNRFFAPFDAGGTHEGRLTLDELRLIAEWLDIGAQYYNDPFAVPVM
jgi:hypothetical protein